MRVLVIGANGQIGEKVVHNLLDAEYTPRAMVRKEEQIKQFEEIGAEVVLADLEEDISHAFEHVDGVVFTAGSGADTPKSQTKVIDRDGAIKAVDEAEKHDASRFIMVSAFGADFDPEEWSDRMEHYYKAKSEADEYLKDSGLDYTILKPGRLTNEEAKGEIQIGKRTEERGGSITREDVAEVIVQSVDSEVTHCKSLELLQGDTPIPEALENLS